MKRNFKSYNYRNLKYKKPQTKDSSEKYVEGFLTRLCVCALICAIVFGFSKLDSPEISAFISKIKYAVNENIDLNEAKEVFNNLYEKAAQTGSSIYDSAIEEETASEIWNYLVQNKQF